MIKGTKNIAIYSLVGYFLLFKMEFIQSQDSIQKEIDSLNNVRYHLVTLKDTILSSLKAIDARINDLELELLKAKQLTNGYPGKIAKHYCAFKVSEKEIMTPTLGAKVLVTGVDDLGWWRLICEGRQGTIPDDCVEFDDKSLNVKLIKAEFRRIEEARKDSLARAKIARIEEEQSRIEATRLAYNSECDEIGKTNYPFRVDNISITEVNSANGVDFSINCSYFKRDKTIKYLYFTLVPYNAVGDRVVCQIRGASEFTGKVTGPIEAQYEPFIWYWEAAWYNSTIECLKLIKLRVEYTDGSAYTYAAELNKILRDYHNDCSYK